MRTRSLAGYLPRISERKVLGEIRKALVNSIPHSYADTERRAEPRLNVARPGPAMHSPGGVILDLSLSGVAIEAASVCRYARGELHRLTLRVGAGSVELDGRVRWTQSAWKSPGETKRNDYVQTAGMEFSETMSQDSHEILRILREMVENQNIAVEVWNSKAIKPSTVDAGASIGMVAVGHSTNAQASD